MELTGRIRVLGDGGFGVWRVEASPSDLRFLGDPLSRSKGRSVLMLGSFELSDDGGFLVFPLNRAKVLVLGEDIESLAISSGCGGGEPIVEQIAAPASRESSKHLPTSQGLRSGDQAFIDACRSELLPEKTVKLAQDFLGRIREFSRDELKEGKHRKWVTHPQNFLALTIQNRKKQYCVHVKRTSVLSGLSNVLDIRDDRPGYVRFWLQDESQLEAAVRAAKGSYGI